MVARHGFYCGRSLAGVRDPRFLLFGSACGGSAGHEFLFGSEFGVARVRVVVRSLVVCIEPA